jgi:alpha/beta superfamily hydrolase
MTDTPSRALPPLPDEREELLETPDGLLLDSRVALPTGQAAGRAVICHPHPLHGGTMQNKVVTTATRAAAAAGLATVRFDFRGVGASEGEHEHGEGERLDVRAALRHADRQASSGLRLLAGFSFGSAMSASVVSEGELVDLLILVGPPLATFELPRPPLPHHGILAVVGDRDSFCPLDQLETYIGAYDDTRARMKVVPDADHFFHGQLDLLAGHVCHAIDEALRPLDQPPGADRSIHAHARASGTIDAHEGDVRAATERIESISKTRVVELKDGQNRQQAVNAHTMVLDFEEVQRVTFQHSFLQHYREIRSIVEGYKRPGVAMVAIDGPKLIASACLGAKRDRINVAIVGRHGVADLFLPDDPSLSLRHLVVIIYPHRGRDEPRVRLVDLRTAAAFADERGQRMEALEAEGPLFLSVGRYLLYIFPTGDETPWPDDAKAGWECIPERVYLSDSPAEPDRWQRRRIHDGGEAPADDGDGPSLSGGLQPAATDVVDLAALEARQQRSRRADATPAPEIDAWAGQRTGEGPPPELSAIAGQIDDHASQQNQAAKVIVDKQAFAPARRRTLVQAFAGPSRARRSLLGEHEPPLGALRVRSDKGVSTIIVGGRAAREGALFGRYDRCDNEGLTVLSNGRISRVHMLLIEIAGELYAIDAASTNGIWVDGQERRVVPLRFGKRWMLGDKLAWMEWLVAE